MKDDRDLRMSCKDNNDEATPTISHQNGAKNEEIDKISKQKKKMRKYLIFKRTQVDVTDSPNDLEVSIISLVFTVISIFAYVVDIFSDLVVAGLFLQHGFKWWFALTLVLTIVPGIVINAFSFKWFVDDERNPPQIESFKQPLKTRNEKIAILMTHIFGLGPAIRHWYLLKYGIECRAQKQQKKERQIREPIGDEDKDEEGYNYEQLLIDGSRDASMLSMIESFMEGAPQLLLQIYILVLRGHPISGHINVAMDVWQVISIVISLINLSWAIASYHRALRLAVVDKMKMSRGGQIVHFLWHFCIVSSRVFAMALFASRFQYWLAPLFIGHWGLMTSWIIHQNTEFCSDDSGKRHPAKEYLFDMVMGVVYLFCYINLKEGQTRYRYCIYYTIVCIENCIGVSLWHHYAEYKFWYKEPAMAWVILTFVFGVGLMLVYYAFLHPNGKMVNISVKESTERPWFGMHVTTSSTSQNENNIQLEPTCQSAIFFIDDESDGKKAEIEMMTTA